MDWRERLFWWVIGFNVEMAEGDFVDGGDLSQGVVECQYTDILLIAKPRTKIPLVGQQKSMSSNQLYLDSRMLDQQFDLVNREYLPSL
jgi:hypothetical protein